MKLCYFPLLVLTAVICYAADVPTDVEKQLNEAQKLIESLKPQSGEIDLRKGLAKLSLPEDLRYLSPNDSVTVLKEIWGNPVDEAPLGMIVPAGFSPLDVSSWAVVITYSDEGHVHDKDAVKINYDELLQTMKKSTTKANVERVKQGYPTVELIGWATSPHYEAVSHKLYWAKDIQFGDSKTRTLNYNIRILGRTGVLELNAIATVEDLPRVESITPKILAAVDFQPGNRYADYKQETDKTATYGIAALVAGGIAAKAGLFKVLWVGILAFKKLILVGAIATAGFVKKLFSRKKSEFHNDSAS